MSRNRYVCIRDPASIRTTRFTNKHVFKTPKFLVLYLLPVWQCIRPRTSPASIRVNMVPVLGNHAVSALKFGTMVKYRPQNTMVAKFYHGTSTMVWVPWYRLGMLISDFSKIRISNLKIRYKSGYRFWLCRSRPEKSDSVFPYFGLVVRSLQLYRLSGRRRRLMIASVASCRAEWGEGNWADWLTAHGRHTWGILHAISVGPDSMSVILSCRWSEHERCGPMPNECSFDCGLSASTQFVCSVLNWLCNPVVLPPSVGNSFSHSLHWALAPPATLVKCFHTSDLFLRVDIVFTLLSRYRLLASN